MKAAQTAEPAAAHGAPAATHPRRRRRAVDARAAGDRAAARGLRGAARRERPDGHRDARARAGRSADLRHQDAGPERRRRAARRQEDRSGHPRHHDHGVRVDRDRRRSDAARRVRLPEQAVRHRSAQDEGAREDREPPAAAGERAAQADARAVAPVLEHHRPQRGDARRLQDDRDRRPHQQHDPADRRVRHRQGARRAGDSLPLAAARQADGVAQLRRDAGDAARVGALRPHARRVHRRRHRTRRGCSRSPRRARSSSTRSAR